MAERKRDAQDADDPVKEATQDEAELAEGAELVEDADADDEDDEEDEAEEENGLRASYETDAKTGLTKIVIEGRYETSVQAEEDKKTGRMVYTSPDFRAPQDDFKSAIEWVGRNVGTRTLRAEYDRQTSPLDGSSGRRNAQTVRLEAQIKAAEQRAAQMEKIALSAQETSQQTQMALQAIMSRLGLDQAQPSSEESGAPSEPGNSESSEKGQTEKSGGTEKPESRGRNKGTQTSRR